MSFYTQSGLLGDGGLCIRWLWLRSFVSWYWYQSSELYWKIMTIVNLFIDGWSFKVDLYKCEVGVMVCLIMFNNKYLSIYCIFPYIIIQIAFHPSFSNQNENILFIKHFCDFKYVASVSLAALHSKSIWPFTPMTRSVR